ncbi:MAG TPA: efflux RND transporter periplasmic adaptor subunit [Polyangiaceae bacterium]|jgi:HlyD family secretion protein|nr:efflux RND transporter periplasmic adaptor subunit [Polyangiaceae bacterium]
MRKLLPFAVVLGVLLAFGGTLAFLYQKSQPKPAPYQTVQPKVTTIVKKAVAPGAIVPRREVVLKPRMSGIIEKLYVEPGQEVKERALVAKILIIPNMVNLNAAESRVIEAELSVANATREYGRSKDLVDQQLGAQTELSQRELTLQLKTQELNTARNNLQLVKEGAARNAGKVGNLVTSTVAGTVLDIPVKEGSSVIEANNFNEGTTIAVVADMKDLIFQGRVDESEVGKVDIGMPVTISVGALGAETLVGKVEYISPKGKERDGTMEFEIRASVAIKSGVLLRANYSANADIILERHEQVLAIDEGAVRFEQGQPYVEIELEPNRFERRSVKLGLSDGLLVEVVSGVEKESRLKKQEPENKNKSS